MAEQKKSCDIKIWCKECERSEYTRLGDKYLCASCGKIINLDHEVNHDIYPHITGDTDKLY